MLRREEGEILSEGVEIFNNNPKYGSQNIESVHCACGFLVWIRSDAAGPGKES